MDLTTPEGVVALMRTSKSEREWKANCDKVKAANNGHYPEFWYVTIIQSGLGREITTAWGDPGALDIKIKSY